jgi:sulfur carrier protein
VSDVLINVSFNGRPVNTAAATLGQLLQLQGVLNTPVACAVNKDFVPRARWSQHPLQAGDRIDVVTPVTGG